ncbi:unnamed protein product [Mytilus edulis]|uniref:Endonuclease/exonuclease/phosphatase domain-containing protein n=1 Tax=Mytilus edulis TaxID=6550 RepID=A0A8S3V5B4_MYTED|nr:unnamed protein product [Mytilus edulis]
MWGNTDDPWVCPECNSFHFSDSFFNNSYEINSNEENSFSSLSSSLIYQNDTSASDESPSESDVFDQLRELKKRHPMQFTCAYLNINSLRHKFCLIEDLLSSSLVEMLFIAETKIDSSFPDAQFRVNDYHLWRADRNQNGGGLVAYARSDLVCDRKCNLEFNSVESICVDLFVNNRKWLITGLYRPPSMSNSEFIKDFIDTFDKASTKYDYILMLGDLNYDMLVNEKSNTLKDAWDVCDLTNLVHEPTCHTKGNNPSLIDVVLTNKSSLCMNIRNFNTGISDVHNMISVQIKGQISNKTTDLKYNSAAFCECLLSFL